MNCWWFYKFQNGRMYSTWGGASWGDLYGYNYTILTPKQIGIRPSNYADTHIYICKINQSHHFAIFNIKFHNFPLS